ncbi:lysozyme inhibitor LprI family protein [Pseudorhodobacter ferrugineus]|uniref:lysozyme inhibitor LprI family protein n=1 Tax=Pseudorhodobacter ferrugineus TaxID=77008 RepID=UPI0003B4133C|nr:lysozyme inhibitor LprI family protein [Pseudorhodobacter ferrugineus]
MTGAVEVMFGCILKPCGLAVGLLAVASVVYAEDGPVVDENIIKTCLQSASYDTSNPACIGDAAETCMSLPDGATTFGMTSCLAAEANVWRSSLEQELAALKAELQNYDESRAGTFTALQAQQDKAQAAWQVYARAQCDLEVGIVIDGTISGPTAAACEMDLLAQRTIKLRLLRRTVE